MMPPSPSPSRVHFENPTNRRSLPPRRRSNTQSPRGSVDESDGTSDRSFRSSIDDSTLLSHSYSGSSIDDDDYRSSIPNHGPQQPDTPIRSARPQASGGRQGLMDMFRSSVRGLGGSSARRRSSATHTPVPELRRDPRDVRYTEKDWEREQAGAGLYDPPLPPTRSSHSGRTRKESYSHPQHPLPGRRSERDMEEGRGLPPRRDKTHWEKQGEKYRMQGGVFSQLLKLSALPQTLPDLGPPGGYKGDGLKTQPPREIPRSNQGLPTLKSLGINQGDSLFHREYDDMELDSEDPRVTGVIPRRNARSGEDGVFLKMFMSGETGMSAEEYQRQEIQRQVSGKLFYPL